MSDFSDRPFVAGSLIGLRAFSVDSLGRLVGPSVNQVFTPTENLAECRRPQTMGWSSGSFAPASFSSPIFHSDPASSSGSAWITLNTGPPKVSLKKKPPHVLGGLGCTCGFYAYFDGRNDYKDGDHLAALIEGYGVCTVGSRGFRASKARVVALVAPGKRFPRGLVPLVLRNYPDVPVYASKHEAMDAHPLTVPEVPSPESCDDFWTRSAS